MAAAVPGVRNVVSEMHAKGVQESKPDYDSMVRKGRDIGVIERADVVIIGAGIIGAELARELSKYDLKIVVVERGDDVAVAPVSQITEQFIMVWPVKQVR